MHHQQSRLNNDRRVHTAHVGVTGATGSGDIGGWVTGPTRHLLYKATLLRLGDIIDLPNTRNKHREVAKMERQINMSQMKEEKPTENELNEMEVKQTKNLLNMEFKTIIIRMLKELTENFNSIKRT